ncbi:MAG TPA: DUF3047 domain-containing protein [Methylomirabilota bacterium]|jgi:hypothetical protein
MIRLLVSLSTAAALAVTLPITPARAADTLPVENWSTQPEGKTGIPEGWKGQSWGSPKYDFRIETVDGRKVLHLKSDGDSSAVSKEVKVDVKAWQILEWSWRVVKLPAGGDARKSATDDEAAQIYVVFPRFPTAVRSRIIAYIWDTTAPVGAIFKSEKTGTVTYVVVRSGPSDVGKWITERRNVFEDFKKIYGDSPSEDAGVISVLIDSNDTRSSAESFVGEILFRKP